MADLIRIKALVMRTSFWAAAFLSAMFLCAANSFGMSERQEPSMGHPTIQQAQRMRGDIDRRYRLLRASGQLKINGTGHNSITDVVVQYIKPGTALDDATAFLRAAGFDVKKPGEHVLYPHGVYAVIDHYAPVTLGNVSVVVVLQLAGSDVQPTVKSAQADIVLQMP